MTNGNNGHTQYWLTAPKATKFLGLKKDNQVYDRKLPRRQNREGKIEFDVGAVTVQKTQPKKRPRKKSQAPVLGALGAADVSAVISGFFRWYEAGLNAGYVAALMKNLRQEEK